MRLVIIESPLAGDFERNKAYARACMADCLRRGEAPYASHLLYAQPGILDDTVPEERELGITAGLEWGKMAAATVVYEDLGISDGMVRGIARAIAESRPVEYRKIPGLLFLGPFDHIPAPDPRAATPNLPRTPGMAPYTTSDMPDTELPGMWERADFEGGPE